MNVFILQDIFSVYFFPFHRLYLFCFTALFIGDTGWRGPAAFQSLYKSPPSIGHTGRKHRAYGWWLPGIRTVGTIPGKDISWFYTGERLVLLAFSRSLTIVISITFVYTCVVFTLLCPNSFCTVVMFTPLYINKVALVCLAVWKDIFLCIPASLDIIISSLFTFELSLRLKKSERLFWYLFNISRPFPLNNR